ncbi:helix-turn-helix domain-containing protein, partial [Streptomyces yaizuensis]
MDPQAGPVEEFAFGLRKLRVEAGQPTYRVLASRAGFSVSALSQAAGGRELPSLRVALAYVRACGGEVGEWEARWRQAAAAVRDTTTAGAGVEVVPYRGLARYESGDGALFFGRERVTADVLALVGRRRFAAVFGPSGSGKSSLLRAAVIPALRRPGTPDGPGGPGLGLGAIRILTPGSHPARTHTHLLTPTAESGEVLVVVDQFEEVFTLCRDPDQREGFLRLLLAARN